MDYRALAAELFEWRTKAQHSPFRGIPQETSHGEMGILIYLLAHHDGASAGDLSKWMRITTGRVATALKSLEKKKYIQRRSDESDKRKVLVYVTDAGKAFAHERYEEALSGMEKILSMLGEDDAREFVRISKRIMKCK
jgi:DNA-binding MarR family transcriptional regulator